ncbi:unnamed protein product [Medioppia subpectinata]|uniref:G-protein coupled receptors family 2 profile 2 domain-containing protein n=1 Tax=Medioppia subpectinata TaxID=1979941 RepID=A0A7R9KT03_9ACAR|nr:unnamed protein product [Medioppia subpectinata]CAG2108057.1 unnamed protein product [Medioppia subpectinata]
MPDIFTGFDTHSGIVNRVRLLFERALNSHQLSNCVTLWRLYIKFELNCNNTSKARSVFYRALQTCSYSKILCESVAVLLLYFLLASFAWMLMEGYHLYQMIILILCESVAVLLLYFLLASFAWMLMEGYHLYQMIILVFSNVGHLRLIYLYIIGYGVPVVITLSALLGFGFDFITEEDSYFCWISSPTHPYRVWAVAAPALLSTLANAVIMCLALKEAFSAKVKKKIIQEKDISATTSTSQISSIATQIAQSLSWIKGSASLVVVLGITWITFLFYIHEFGEWFSYIFIVFNGLQGALIFTFQILLNDKARSVVRKSYHKRHPSRYLSSLYRTASSNMFTSRSKSLSKTVSLEPSNDSSDAKRKKKRVTKKNSDSNSSSSDVSHRSQTISAQRVRNASNSHIISF